MVPTNIIARLFELPSKYRFLKLIGAGFFAKVVKCLDKETGETVAIKLPQRQCQDTKEEISTLKKIKSLNLDKHNIVKFIDSYQTSCGEAFVFESLDISLREYMNSTNDAPMLLSDIRTIIQQMATAFKALKENDLIHADVKLENIMMVNHQRRPFEVKLIDFGLAIPRSDARKGETFQPQSVRSPEVILSNDVSEAIDMWSLGCAMFQMICGCQPFPGEDEYEIMRGMVKLLGPPDREFFRGQCTVVYFKSSDYITWTIKTRREYYGKYYTEPCKTSERKSHQFKSLDDMKAMRLEENNLTEAVEREQCIELLKAMLTLVGSQRITPSEVLTHPFITKDYLNVQTDVLKTSRSSSEDFECEPLAAPLKDEDSSTIQPDGCTPSPEILPSGVILVRPATSENTTLLEDRESAVSEPPTAPLKDEDSINIQLDDGTTSPEILPSGLILVRPATSENTTLLEDEESAVSEPPTALLGDEDSINIRLDDGTPSPEILPSGVILVWPVTAENTTLLEDEESAVSFQSVLNKTSKSSVSDADDNTKISEDSTTCEDTWTKKKEKNWFRRVLSRLRKKFSNRVSPINQGCVNVRPDVINTSRSKRSNSSSPIPSSNDFERWPTSAPLEDEDSSNIQPDDCPPSPEKTFSCRVSCVHEDQGCVK